MNISDKDFADILQLITTRIGIIPRDAHKDGIRRYVQKRAEELGKENSTFFLDLVSSNSSEFARLINESTVNETYFFREEKQFLFLKNTLFPKLKEQTAISPVQIWSAASSTGEEIYSLLLLAERCGINARFLATDINTDVLQVCRDGDYRPKSVKAVDGASFHSLLEPYRCADGSVHFPEEISSRIDTKKINLAKLSPDDCDLPKNQNVIFLRNVFIYFSRELRASILKTIATKCLAPNGYLFISMNEIPSVDASLIPEELEKCVDGNVFYFYKKA